MSDDNGTAVTDEMREAVATVPIEVREAILAEDRARSPRVSIGREPLTYERHLPRSYFRDRAMAEINGDGMAQARLERHATEMDVEMPRFLDRLYRRSPEGLEARVNPNRIDGQGGFWSPPLYLQSAYATAPRPKRVLASLIPNFLLTAKVSEIKLPRILQGTKVEGETDLSPVANQDVTDASVESWCEMFEGQSDWPLQALEQSPPTAALDDAILRDLLEAYDGSLEESLFSGLGKERQQITGILKLPTGANGVSVVEYTGTKGYEMFTAIGKLAAQVGDARKCPVECWAMRTARWAYIGAAEDSQNLPLAVPGHMAAPPMPFTFDDSRPAVAPPILGWPNYLSDAIPVNLGSEGNADTVVAARPTDSMLFESPKYTSVLKEVLSGTLGVRFQLHGSAAALYRYPTGFAYLTGKGMKVESEW